MKSNENLDMLDYSSNELIKEQIFMLRGRQIILDYDLAKLYGVQTKSLNQAVRRNIERFPCGFMFVLSKEELCELVTNCDRFKNLKHSTVYPNAFTEQEVAMNHGEKKNEIVIYQPNETIRLEVRLENDTVWLSQSQMGRLFGCSTDNIGLHLKNIYDVGELSKLLTTEDFSVVQVEGSRKVTRKIKMYNLDAIISVGYRVNTIRGICF